MLLLFISCSSDSTVSQNEDSAPKKSTRIIDFSGYEWVVRDTKNKKQGPGPNFFDDSENNVWVDTQGRLHLKIIKKGDDWYCAEVTLRKSYGYKQYVFYISSQMDSLDKNIVGGLFTYKNDSEEIDIEFSRWGKSENQNAQFAVQPSNHTGNKVRFKWGGPNSAKSTHFIQWKENSIHFSSFSGHTLNPKKEKIIQDWTYSGNDIPKENEERLKINFWLFKGMAPSNKKEAEMIIDHIEILD